MKSRNSLGVGALWMMVSSTMWAGCAPVDEDPSLSGAQGIVGPDGAVVGVVDARAVLDAGDARATTDSGTRADALDATRTDVVDAATRADVRDAATPDAPVNCCVCQFYEAPGCRTQGTQAGCQGVADCQWVPPPRGGVFGVCKPRHEVDCEDWFAAPAQRGWCTRSAYVPQGADPTGGLTGCTSFRYNYEGHGTGCQNIAQRVRVCVNRQPVCTLFDISDTGCSNFDNLTDAQAAMQTIVAGLGGSTCVTVSANQCTASNACQSRYIYTINSTGVCGNPGACNFGALCHGHNESAVCRDGAANANQVCCCASRDAGTGCTWRRGTTCP